MKTVRTSDQFGTEIRDLRERLGWSRTQASKHTKLAETFIAALEEECWREIGDPVYAERMLRSYVRMLGGNERYIIGKYTELVREHKLKRPENACIPRASRIHFRDLAVGPRWIALGTFFLFVIILGGYIYRQASSIGAPPTIAIESPKEGTRLKLPSVEVIGRTEPDVIVKINGRQAVVQPDGLFKFWMDVPRGTTEIVVIARKRHGNEAQAVRHVVYDRLLPSLGSAADAVSFR